jgi:multiple sugar transport system ATP-binding protein
MAEVTLRETTKTFDDTTAVANLSLTIADGECVVLLGPTGAGKTTTLRLVAGLERPDTGNVLIRGTDVTGLEPAARNVAMVFQQYSLYPHYTAYENLAFPLKSPLHRLAKDEIDRRVREIAQLLRIDHKLNNKATKLSGGEMQRVAIGRALVREPAIFLMDEPLSSLDAKLRHDLRIELKRIQVSLGATILYVTHDQIEAMTLADRIGVLSEGRLIQLGSPAEVYQRPDTVEVAKRLGSPRINLLPAGSLGLNPPSGTVTQGVRPEDIVLDDGGEEATVTHVEHLGAETVIQLRLQDQEIHLLAPVDRSFAAGQTVAVRSRHDAALYFDAKGMRLAGEASGGAHVHAS